YRERKGDVRLEPGQYTWNQGSLFLHRRAFEHPNRPEPAREVVIRVANRTVQQIVDQATGRQVGAFVLEPVPVGAYYGPDREQRELVSLPEVPRHLVDAVLAVEDQR
ncbi:MAG: hypothetical protein GWO24_21545, partial [Akkermansiaceae bacterium]|nr:hypothetical protein [Akkermansiaceae bacterium]